MNDDCEWKVNEAWNDKEWLKVWPWLELRRKFQIMGKNFLRRAHQEQTWILKKLKDFKAKYLSVCDPTEETKAEFLEASKTLDALLLRQEIYWHQRCQIAWLKYRDKNTKFFHSKASQQQWRNFIHGIRDQEQNWVEKVEEIAEVATTYFESIYSSGGNNRMEECLDTVPWKVTLDMADTLSSDYSAEEIKVALF